jgi:hypothetical protein
MTCISFLSCREGEKKKKRNKKKRRRRTDREGGKTRHL